MMYLTTDFSVKKMEAVTHGSYRLHSDVCKSSGSCHALPQTRSTWSLLTGRLSRAQLRPSFFRQESL